jgi:hypothetical protein
MELYRYDVQDGLHCALIGPGTVPGLASLIDDGVGHVLMLGYSPIQWQWTETSLPLDLDNPRDTDLVLASRVTVDLLLTPADFKRRAPGWADIGLRVLQFRDRPRADVDYDDPRLHARRARYELSKLLVSIDLPHADESAQVSALTKDDLNAALARTGLGV